jgi:hypothetical protein
MEMHFSHTEIAKVASQNNEITMDHTTIEIQKTFKLVMPMQIMFVGIWLFFVGVGIYSWLIESSPVNILIIPTLAFAITLWWIRTMRLEISDFGVSFRSGLYYRSLPWSDIHGISFRNIHWGSGGEMSMYIFSNNPHSKPIKFNRLYFAGDKLKNIILSIMKRVPNLIVDTQIIKELEKRGIKLNKDSAA